MANTDAKVGIGVVGQTILATWWSYPSTPGLRLVGNSVDAILGSVGPAGLGLGTLNPRLVFVAKPATLGLAAIAPTLALTQIMAVPGAGLGLGVDLPVYTGPVWLWSEACDTITLKPVECL